MLYELKKAYHEDKNLEIMYLGKNNKVSQRVIRILELNKHIVKAYCYQRKALHFFRVENMLSGRIVMPYKKVKGA